MCLIQVLYSYRPVGKDVGALENETGQGGHIDLGPEQSGFTVASSWCFCVSTSYS